MQFKSFITGAKKVCVVGFITTIASTIELAREMFKEGKTRFYTRRVN